MSWKEEEKLIKKELKKKVEELEKMLKDNGDETEIEKLFNEIIERSICYDDYSRKGWNLLKKHNPKLDIKISEKISCHPTK